MTDKFVETDAALERVIVAARAHLAAVKAADGELDDDEVWDAYVALNNASHEYDELLSDVFGEVTPWDVEALTSDEGDLGLLTGESEGPMVGVADDPYPMVVSVRQRRDYRVPSVSALRRVALADPDSAVGDALVELLQNGDGSLAMLDISELDPLDGVVMVCEIPSPYEFGGQADQGPSVAGEPSHALAEEPFRLDEQGRLLARLDERSVPYRLA